MPSANAPIALLRSSAFARWCEDRKGAMAVEFAMVAMPFIFTILALFELALILLLSTTLDSSTVKVARLIRTGQLQTQGTPATADEFRTQVCSNLGWLQSQCMDNLSVDVRVFPKFAGVSGNSPITGGAIDPAKLNFNIGSAGDIVVVTTYFQWKIITPGLSFGFNTLSNGKAVITSVATFRNEPYA
jgi:Flp pilus assembly protein TadG